MAVLSSANQTLLLAAMRRGIGPTAACASLSFAIDDYEETKAADAAFSAQVKQVYATWAEDAMAKLARQAIYQGDKQAAAQLLAAVPALPLT